MLGSISTQPLQEVVFMPVDADSVKLPMRDDEVRSETLELARSYQALIAERRLDEWIELWDEGGSCEFPFAPQGRKRLYRGKGEIYAYMTAYPGRIAIDSVAEQRIHPMLDPEVAVIELAINGRALPTGRPYNQRYVAFLEARNGKVWRYREYWNPLISIDAFGGMDARLSGFGLLGDGKEPWAL
jgi:uncharacterized protein